MTTIAEQITAGVKRAVVALVAGPAFADTMRAGLTEALAKRATTTAAPEPCTPETLAKVSALVGFPVDATLAKAALAEDTDESPVGRYLAGRGLHLEGRPEDALPAELVKALGLGGDRVTDARVALDAQLTRGPGQRLAGLQRHLAHEAALEARAEGRTEDLGTLAKAAGATAASILDVARSIPRALATIPAPDPDGPDRREEIRALAARQRAFGNHDGAAQTERGLIHEEAKALARTHRVVVGSMAPA